MDLATKFQDTHPHAFFLDDENVEALENYLRYNGWIDDNQSIQSVKKAGKGNMNKVLRIQLSNAKSYIFKQSRPWVEKYPDIPAPPNRATIEGLFIEKTTENETIASFLPKLLRHDTDSHILMIEDLGESSDLSYLYDNDHEIKHYDRSDTLHISATP